MQGYLGAAARRSGQQGGRTQGLRLVINPPQLRLDDHTIVFKFNRDGGWVCASFGAGAEYMRAAKEDAALRRRIDVRAQKLLCHRSALSPDLARVMAAVELAKDYDPNQPRDEQGRWTSEGAAGAAGGLVADAARMFGNPAYAEGLKQIAARALAAVQAFPTAVGDAAVAAGAPAAAFFGTLFFPTPRNLVQADGTLSDTPDYSYHFDQEAGHLTITHQLDDGTSETVFDGRYDKDGVFRDSDGNPIGRFLGDSVALDADAVRGYEARQRSDAQAPPGAIAQTDTATRSDPKLCPDPTTEALTDRKERGILYQSQISGMPPGFDFKLINPATGNPVSFDACWEEKDGAMGEAKGPGYLDRMIDPLNWQKWYRGLGAIEDQMARQASAAHGREVEWHFAEEQVANYFSRYVEAHSRTLSNIHVFYTPPTTQ